jgi:hypothetical protein
MSHKQEQWMQRDQRSYAVRALRPQIEAWSASQSMVTAGSALGAERRRRDWRVCSVGDCEPRCIA